MFIFIVYLYCLGHYFNCVTTILNYAHITQALVVSYVWMSCNCLVVTRLR